MAKTPLNVRLIDKNNILHIGTLKNPDVLSSDYKDFPFSKVMFKRELIQPHKFVLKDTNNA